MTSPVKVGTPTTLAAVATGGLGPYTYKFWVHNGSSWSVGQDWSGGLHVQLDPADHKSPFVSGLGQKRRIGNGLRRLGSFGTDYRLFRQALTITLHVLR